MLQAAAAADAEVGAARRYPSTRGVQDRSGPRLFEGSFPVQDLDGHFLAAERAFDEDDLALGVVRDAAPLEIEGLDAKRQAFQSERNSRQCGCACFSRKLLRSAHSRSYCSFVSAQRMSWKRRKRR